MRVQVVRTSGIVRNIILFLIFSILFVHVVEALKAGVSAANIDLLKAFLLDKVGLITLAIIAFIGVRIGKSFSKPFFFLFTLLVNIYVYYLFFQDFDKTILLLGFIYSAVSYFFNVLLKLELEDCVYFPNFSRYTIGNKNDHQIPVTIEHSGNSYSGYLTNCGDSGCFVYISDESKQLKKGQVKITTNFLDHNFEGWGVIVSRYDKGIGIKLKSKYNKDKNIELGWKDFYQLVRDRGYFVR